MPSTPLVSQNSFNHMSRLNWSILLSLLQWHTILISIILRCEVWKCFLPLFFFFNNVLTLWDALKCRMELHGVRHEITSLKYWHGLDWICGLDCVTGYLYNTDSSVCEHWVSIYFSSYNCRWQFSLSHLSIFLLMVILNYLILFDLIIKEVVPLSSGHSILNCNWFCVLVL